MHSFLGTEEGAPRITIADDDRQRTARPKWHVVYFLLAGFDLITIMISLSLNHSLVTHYQRSVKVQSMWADRLGRYSDLGHLAGVVNAPGNDVFDSRNTDAERARMRAALPVFRDALADVRRDLERDADADTAGRLIQELVPIERAMDEMVAEAELIFSYFRLQQADKAGERMATMDRKYASVHAAVQQLTRHVRDIQQALFARDAVDAASLAKIEYVIAAFIVLIVVGVAVYGHRMARNVAETTRLIEKQAAALATSETHTRSIVNNAMDGIISIDDERRIVDFNPAAESIFGHAREEVLGRDFTDFLAPLSVQTLPWESERSAKADEHALHGERVELSATRRDGTRFPVELSVTRVELNGTPTYTVFLRDISERIQAEMDLRNATQAAEAANVAKSAFLANMSHEIRTPMNGIIGMTELALDTRLEDDAREYLTMVQTSADALLDVINDILDFSKIEAGKLDLDPTAFDIRDGLGSTLKTFALRAHKKGLELAFRIQPGRARRW